MNLRNSGRAKSIGGASGAIYQTALDQTPDQKIEAGEVIQLRAQAAQGHRSHLSRHGLQHQLLGGRSVLVAVLEERQVQLVKQRRFDALIFGEINVRQPDPTARESAEILQEVGIAGRLPYDLADERQPEAAATAGERDGQRLLGRVKVGAMLGGALLVGSILAPATVRILLLWNVGLAGALPSAAYGAAAFAIGVAMVTAVRRGQLATAAGVTLLVAGGIGLQSTYQSGLVLVGLAALALRHALGGETWEPAAAQRHRAGPERRMTGRLARRRMNP